MPGQNSKPNILFILTDDMGFADTKYLGHPYLKTPNIDRLAQEGTTFTEFSVNSTVCAPSRVSLMTGQFPSRHQVFHIYASRAFNESHGMPDWLDPNTANLARILRKAGYTTAHFGKWHLCGDLTDGPSPGEYGFDEAKLLGLNPGELYSDSATDGKKDPFFRSKSTSYIVDDAIDFMKKAKKAGKPFYVNLWTILPHAPLNPTPEEMAEYDNLIIRPEDFPSYMRQYVENARDPQRQMQTYCAAMTGMDKALGKILDWLRREGIDKNTFIFFTSDNGPEDYHVGNAANAGMGYPGITRGRKRSLYEGGTRVAAICKWPGHVEAGRIDTTSIVSGVDFFPTICAITGATAPRTHSLDGEDISDTLFKRISRPRQKPIIWDWRYEVEGDPAYRAPVMSIREGRWKFFMNPDGTCEELYDIPADPEERINIAKKNRSVSANLADLLMEYWNSLPLPLPSVRERGRIP